MEPNLKTFPLETTPPNKFKYEALIWRYKFIKELQNLKQGKNMLKWLEENIGDWKVSHVSNTLGVFIEDLLGA